MQSELDSFLIEITAIIMAKKDDKDGGFLVDKIVDQTGSKGTGGRHVQNRVCETALLSLFDIGILL